MRIEDYLVSLQEDTINPFKFARQRGDALGKKVSDFMGPKAAAKARAEELSRQRKAGEKKNKSNAKKKGEAAENKSKAFWSYNAKIVGTHGHQVLAAGLAAAAAVKAWELYKKWKDKKANAKTTTAKLIADKKMKSAKKKAIELKEKAKKAKK